MKNRFYFLGAFLCVLLLGGMVFTSCSKDDDDGIKGKIDPSTIAKTNLIAYFPFNGNGNDTIGIMEPTESPNVTFVSGRRGAAYQGANNGYFLYDLPTNSKLRSLKEFSISMWFYGTPAIDGVAPVPGIIQINGTSDATWGNLCLTQDRMPDAADSLNIKMVFHKEGATWANQFIGFSNTKFVENFWIHLVFTYNNANSRYLVYVNGDSLKLNTGITNRWAAGDDVSPRPALGELAFSNATEMSIGGWMQRIIGASSDEWMGYFTGKMDELRMYDRDLTADEVKALYKAEVSQLNE